MLYFFQVNIAFDQWKSMGQEIFLATMVNGHEFIQTLKLRDQYLNNKIGNVYKKSKFWIASTAIIKRNLNSESNVRPARSVDCNFVLTS